MRSDNEHVAPVIRKRATARQRHYAHPEGCIEPAASARCIRRGISLALRVCTRRVHAWMKRASVIGRSIAPVIDRIRHVVDSSDSRRHSRSPRCEYLGSRGLPKDPAIVTVSGGLANAERRSVAVCLVTRGHLKLTRKRPGSVSTLGLARRRVR